MEKCKISLSLVVDSVPLPRDTHGKWDHVLSMSEVVSRVLIDYCIQSSQELLIACDFDILILCM